MRRNYLHSALVQMGMRKLTIIEYISLDGATQAEGTPDEDGDYPYGGWAFPFSDPAGGEAILDAHGERFDLLLGRLTYNIWAQHWPKAKDGPLADPINAATKYVATHGPDSLAWGPSQGLGSHVVPEVRRIKAQGGPSLILWGSSSLTLLLLEDGLADEVLLLICPVLLGIGKRFFSEGNPPRELKLQSSKALPSGLLINSYSPRGSLRTGSFAAA